MASTGNKSKKNASGKNTGSNKRKTTSAARSGSSRKKTDGSGGRKTAGRKSAKSSGRKTPVVREKEYIDYALYLEVILWVILAFSILLLISYFGVGGKAGDMISGGVFGLFGAMAYIFPFMLFFMTAFLISNSRSRIARIKAGAVIVLYFVLCGAMQLILIGYNHTYTISEYYESGRVYHTGGGFFGGLITSALCPVIGVVGTAVVLFFIVIICAILISQQSFVSGVKKGSAAVRRSVKQSRMARKEQARIWQDERELNREKAEAERAAADHSRRVTMSVLPDEVPMRRRERPAPILPITLSENNARSSSQAALSVKMERQDTAVPAGDVPASEMIADDWSEDLTAHEMLLETEPAAMKKLRESTKVRTKAAARQNELPEQSAAQKAEKMPVHEVFLQDDSDADSRQNEISAKESALAAKKPVSSKEYRDDDWMNNVAGMFADDEIQEDDTHREHAQPVQNTVNAEKETQQTGAEKKEHTSSRRPRSSQEEIEQNVASVEKEIEKAEAVPAPEYVFPTTDLMKKPSGQKGKTTKDELRSTAAKLQQVFDTFGVNVHITNVTCGPSVTRYELMPEMGVKVAKILNLQDDIKLNLAAEDIRIEAPIPGKAAVGIEVPNKEKADVSLREMLESEEFKNHPSKLCYAVGKDIGGNIIVSDIARMPHLLVAGATGSGKSVFINTLIMSILYKAKPDEVKMIMVDPKVVELSVYNDIPHLLIPVVTDPKKAAGALNWAVAEMMKRYEMFAQTGVRDLKGYNKCVEMQGDDVPEDQRAEKMPQIVIIIDELADLMMVASAEVEDAICRLAQLARAAGIHLIIATQRPSVDVITGLIKANMPSRIAFSVSSGVDSRTILDTVGAEKLLGYGDMLFAPQTFKQPLRVQGAFIDDTDVANVVSYIRDNNGGEQIGNMMAVKMAEVESSISSSSSNSDADELFAQAGRFIIEKDKASIGMLQRWFKIGFNRAARIMDQLSEAGVVGPEEGTKPRKILMSEEQFENYLEQN